MGCNGAPKLPQALLALGQRHDGDEGTPERLVGVLLQAIRHVTENLRSLAGWSVGGHSGPPFTFIKCLYQDSVFVVGSSRRSLPFSRALQICITPWVTDMG